MAELVNKIAQSGLITIDLGKFYHPGERVTYDIKQNLFHELMLKEKDFRAFVKENDWSVYKGMNVAVHCSNDAIIAKWAYMLLIAAISPFANRVVYGDLETLEAVLYLDAFAEEDLNEFKDQRVILKGCGDLPVPVSAYAEMTRQLMPIVQSIMYGEPCSTVPVYKRPK
ncbi:MAG: hypothetical protein ACJATA_002199 [Sphingobacteriales bacterium]|jgi:hypothetical protein